MIHSQSHFASPVTHDRRNTVATPVAQTKNAVVRRKRSPHLRSPYELRRHIIWRTIPIWIGTYKVGKRGTDLTMVKTPYPPPKRKKMGNRVYRLVSTTQTTQECIIMAKATKKAPVVTDDELDELDALEELDELEDDEDTDEVVDSTVEDDTDDDDDDDEEEAEPAPKKRKRQAANDPSSKPSRSRTTDGKVGTSEIAAAAGVDGRTLRMVLRKHQVPKDPETGRYEWDSMKDKQVKQILKWIESGEAQDIKTQALDKLKADKAAKKAAQADEAPATKKNKKNKKNKVKVVEEDDDE